MAEHALGVRLCAELKAYKEKLGVGRTRPCIPDGRALREVICYSCMAGYDQSQEQSRKHPASLCHGKRLLSLAMLPLHPKHSGSVKEERHQATFEGHRMVHFPEQRKDQFFHHSIFISFLFKKPTAPKAFLSPFCCSGSCSKVPGQLGDGQSFQSGRHLCYAQQGASQDIFLLLFLWCYQLYCSAENWYERLSVLCPKVLA